MTPLIIGAGKIGSALKTRMEGAGWAVLAWDIDEKKISGVQSLEEGAGRAEVIFLCVPSWSIRGLCEQIKNHIRQGAAVVSLAKGVEEETGKTMVEVMEEVFGQKANCAILVGPMLAKEIEQGVPTAGLIGSRSKEVYDLTRSLFAGSNLKIFYESDARAVALASILKNIYAVGLGVCEALEFGDNGRGWYVSLAMNEMRKIILELKGDGEVAHGLAGIGDLVATGISKHSRNRTVGYELVSKGVCGKSEGCNSLPVIWKKLEGKGSGLPLLSLLKRVVTEEKNARAEFENFFLK